jgi:hypothetical protein
MKQSIINQEKIMNIVRTALFIAVMATTTLSAFAADAAEYQYRRFNKVAGFGDPNRISTASSSVYAGKFFQWFGRKTACRPAPRPSRRHGKSARKWR